MMSDILVEEYPWLNSRFPFCSLPTKGKIVIYNAGAYGRHVFRQLSANGDYEIVGWIDENYEQYCDYDYPVTSIGDVLRDESVFYVIASVYKDYIRDAIEKLKKIHVSENRIVSIYQSIHLIEQQLQDIGLVQLDEYK